MLQIIIFHEFCSVKSLYTFISRTYNYILRSLKSKIVAITCAFLVPTKNIKFVTLYIQYILFAKAIQKCANHSLNKMHLKCSSKMLRLLSFKYTYLLIINFRLEADELQCDSTTLVSYKRWSKATITLPYAMTSFQRIELFVLFSKTTFEPSAWLVQCIAELCLSLFSINIVRSTAFTNDTAFIAIRCKKGLIKRKASVTAEVKAFLLKLFKCYMF